MFSLKVQKVSCLNDTIAKSLSSSCSAGVDIIIKSLTAGGHLMANICRHRFVYRRPLHCWSFILGYLKDGKLVAVSAYIVNWYTLGSAALPVEGMLGFLIGRYKQRLDWTDFCLLKRLFYHIQQFFLHCPHCIALSAMFKLSVLCLCCCFDCHVCVFFTTIKKKCTELFCQFPVFKTFELRGWRLFKAMTECFEGNSKRVIQHNNRDNILAILFFQSWPQKKPWKGISGYCGW